MRRVSETLSRLFMPYHRQSAKDAELWAEIWLVAYELAYFILRFEEGAEEVAYTTILALKGQYKERKRKKLKFKHYRREVVENQTSLPMKERRRATIVKTLLGDAQELEKYVYFYCTEWEKKKVERKQATRNDFDVWFIKYVIQRCLWRNPLYMVVGLCSMIKTYDLLTETPIIWNQVVRLAPKRKDKPKDAEPFFIRWNTLKSEVQERFDSLVRFEKGKLVRRSPNEQPLALAQRCFEMFSPRETDGQCLINQSASLNDNEADIKRFHLLLHSVCNGRVVGGAELPEKNVGLPNYGAQMRNDTDNDRTPPEPSEQKMDEVRNRIRNLFELRNAAACASLLVMVDGKKHSLATDGLVSKGLASLTLGDGAQMLEIKARQSDNTEILMTACPLTQLDRVRSVQLEGGQKLTFDVRYADEGTDRGHYDVNISYRETQLIRMVKLGWQRIRYRGRPESARKLRWSEKLAFVLGALMLMLGGYAILRYENPSPKSAKNGVPAPIPGPTVSQPVSTPSPLTARQDQPPPIKSPAPRPGSVPPTKKSLPVVATTKSDQERPVASIKKIFVEPSSLYRNNEDYNHSVREAQIADLIQSGLFVVTNNKDDADGVLKIAGGYRSAGEETVRPRIVTPSGKLLWEGPHIPISRGNTLEEVKAAARKLTSEITESIRTEIQEERKPK